MSSSSSSSASGGSASAAALPEGYQAKLDQLKQANAKLRDLVGKQQQFDAQHTENSMVKAELEALKEEEPVFKLYGKVLVKQDTAEAKATISQRIGRIEGEL
jgi:chaperonin cofactor prefoldin